MTVSGQLPSAAVYDALPHIFWWKLHLTTLQSVFVGASSFAWCVCRPLNPQLFAVQHPQVAPCRDKVPYFRHFSSLLLGPSQPPPSLHPSCLLLWPVLKVKLCRLSIWHVARGIFSFERRAIPLCGRVFLPYLSVFTVVVAVGSDRPLCHAVVHGTGNG